MRASGRELSPELVPPIVIRHETEAHFVRAQPWPFCDEQLASTSSQPRSGMSGVCSTFMAIIDMQRATFLLMTGLAAESESVQHFEQLPPPVRYVLGQQ